jgi:hypothetical protein
MEKIFLTEQQAIELLPEGEQIHTFLNLPVALIGADMDREEVIDKIRSSDYIEVSGSGARGLKHGLAVYNNGSTVLDVLFIETDSEKLDALYPAEDGE